MVFICLICDFSLAYGIGSVTSCQNSYMYSIVLCILLYFIFNLFFTINNICTFFCQLLYGLCFRNTRIMNEWIFYIYMYICNIFFKIWTLNVPFFKIYQYTMVILHISVLRSLIVGPSYKHVDYPWYTYPCSGLRELLHHISM